MSEQLSTAGFQKGLTYAVKYLRRVYGNDDHTAQDMAVDALLKVRQERGGTLFDDDFQDPSTKKLLRIACRSVNSDYHRTKKHTMIRPHDPLEREGALYTGPDPDTPETLLLQGERATRAAELSALVTLCLNECPEPFRRTLKAYYFEGRSCKELAEAEGGISLGLVKTRLFRGREKVYARMLQAAHANPELYQNLVTKSNLSDLF